MNIKYDPSTQVSPEEEAEQQAEWQARVAASQGKGFRSCFNQTVLLFLIVGGIVLAGYVGLALYFHGGQS
jgi:hypothetical protein